MLGKYCLYEPHDIRVFLFICKYLNGIQEFILKTTRRHLFHV